MAVYVHAQLVAAPITNAMLPGREGTVRADGISAYTTLVVDIDPTPGAAPGEAVAIAGELDEALQKIDPRIDPRALLDTAVRAGRLSAASPSSTQPPRRAPTSAVRCRRSRASSSGQRGPLRWMAAYMTARGSCDRRDNEPQGRRGCRTPAWILRPWTPACGCRGRSSHASPPDRRRRS